jgi:DNA polymerase-1
MSVFESIEMPLVPVLEQMEREGILLDVSFLQELSGEAEKTINSLTKDIHKLAGEEFNINSPAQLREVLFTKLGLKAEFAKKTKTGFSTAAGELEKLLGQHPIVEKIMQYRELTKLQSTYLLSLPEMVNAKTKRIHTSYNQTIAATGRLSSVDPNLQNIPVKGEGLGAEVRKAFVAQKGNVLLSLDYSQIELRVVAHVSQDPEMLRTFNAGEDIHTKTAVGIFGVAPDKVTKDMRRHAKTINFGILYGLSAFGLSYRIHELGHVDAKEYIAKYFETYPGVKAYIDSIKKEVNANGFVKNELGRTRKFPEIKSSQFFIRQAAERAAMNFPIQSLAADVIKIAMININKELQETSDKRQQDCKMLLQVHDELVFEVKEGRVSDYVALIKPLMEGAIKLSVPVTVEAKVGANWGEMEKFG